MEQRALICIGCPMGCPITVTLDNGEILRVEGNSCKRGDTYARKEVTHPTRIVTSTVRLSNASAPVVSVKTAGDIPKEMIFPVMEALKAIRLSGPVRVGDIAAENICGTGVEVLVTKNVT